jgi:hypothetical protein
MQSAVASLTRKGVDIGAAADRQKAALRDMERRRDAELAKSVRLGEQLRATQIATTAAETRRKMLVRGAAILKASLEAADEIGAHLAVVRDGYGTRIGIVEAELDVARVTTTRLATRLDEVKRELSVAAGPRLVGLARKRGVDLLDYLFPLFDLPDGEGPEAALVLAVMRQESGFSHKAVNPSGAAGLMQLMPDTAQQFADKLKLGYAEDKLLDPDFNVTLGRAYLDHLISYYGGSYVLALAAYNAGPTRVSDWIKRFGDPRFSADDPMIWVESIPFRETRRYVAAVMSALQVYRYRLVDGPREWGPRPPAIRAARADQAG